MKCRNKSSRVTQHFVNTVLLGDLKVKRDSHTTCFTSQFDYKNLIKHLDHGRMNIL
jgi:hypothetical protein